MKMTCLRHYFKNIMYVGTDVFDACDPVHF